MATTKEAAISRTASELRLSSSQVRNVVDEYEKNRSAINREKKAAEKAAEPVALGGGWYQLPDGSKVQGKEAAGL